MSETNPKPILDINYAFAQTALLVAAVRLRIFTYLADGPLSSQALATAAQISPETTERFLRGLQVLGLVEPRGADFQLTPLAARFLVENSPSYLGGDTLAMLDYLPAWFQLEKTLRTTSPYRDLGQAGTAEEFFAPRVRDLFPLVYPLATRLAARLDLGGEQRALQILDVGAGSAGWSAAFAQRYPAARVVALDLPAVIAQGREQIEAMGLSQRYTWIAADLTAFSYPPAMYDLVILAHVCRFMGDEQVREVLQKLYHSVRAGGILVLADVLLNADGITPTAAVMLDLSMMVNSSHGRVRSLDEYRGWLEQCGFQQIDPLNVNGPFPLLSAAKGAS